jgi:hypothetical protein
VVSIFPPELTYFILRTGKPYSLRAKVDCEGALGC